MSHKFIDILLIPLSFNVHYYKVEDKRDMYEIDNLEKNCPTLFALAKISG